MTLDGTLSRPVPTFFDKIFRDVFLQKMKLVTNGQMTWVEEYGPTPVTYTFGDPKSELQAKVRVLHPRAYARIALGGTIGGGEAYRDGDVESPDLSSVVRIFASNREMQLAFDKGFGALVSPLLKVAHRLHRNSIEGSRKNISAHYDLGNDFFALFLDSSFMYSSAYYPSEESTLEEAQFEKNDRICKKLDLKASDHLIEIGTGWGGFAIHAAKHFGCKITTTTISKEQRKMAVERIEKEGLKDQITVLFEDYRHLTGKFDKLVSIEMIEAVGLEYLETYFEKCSDLLKPTGRMLIQGITIRDQSYDHARKNVDFIQRYIFPGSGIPSVHSILDATKKKTDLQLANLEDFGHHYVRTLQEWSKRLQAKHDEMLKLGYPEPLYRLWLYYFSYCEGGFRERAIGVSHFLFFKPEVKA